jgi:hypothetical protein
MDITRELPYAQMLFHVEVSEILSFFQNRIAKLTPGEMMQNSPPLPCVDYLPVQEAPVFFDQLLLIRQILKPFKVDFGYKRGSIMVIEAAACGYGTVVHPLRGQFLSQIHKCIGFSELGVGSGFIKVFPFDGHFVLP